MPIVPSMSGEIPNFSGHTELRFGIWPGHRRAIDGQRAGPSVEVFLESRTPDVETVPMSHSV